MVTFLSLSLLFTLRCAIRMIFHVQSECTCTCIHVKANLNFLYNRVIMYASMVHSDAVCGDRAPTSALDCLPGTE